MSHKFLNSDLLTLPGWGGPFDGPWDPLGLSAGATVNDVRRWRESEVTHGRVAMVRICSQKGVSPVSSQRRSDSLRPTC